MQIYNIFLKYKYFQIFLSFYTYCIFFVKNSVYLFLILWELFSFIAVIFAKNKEL